MPGDTGTLAIVGTLIVWAGWASPSWQLFLQRAISRCTQGHALGIRRPHRAWRVGFRAAEARPGDSASPLSDQIKLSLFQSVSARTAGFAGLPNFEAMTPASRWLMMGLMFVGCAPASMGGGITTGAFAVIVLVLLGYVRGQPATRIGGRTISTEAVRRQRRVGRFAAGGLLPPAAVDDASRGFGNSLFGGVGVCHWRPDACIAGDLNVFAALIVAMMFWGGGA
jgi:trk system potassium uptake protein TrkH